MSETKCANCGDERVQHHGDEGCDVEHCFCTSYRPKTAEASEPCGLCGHGKHDGICRTYQAHGAPCFCLGDRPAPETVEGQELANCPFCGSEPRLESKLNHVLADSVYYEITCPQCFGLGKSGYTKVEAIAAWNTRSVSRTTGVTREDAVKWFDDGNAARKFVFDQYGPHDVSFDWETFAKVLNDYAQQQTAALFRSKQEIETAFREFIEAVKVEIESVKQFIPYDEELPSWTPMDKAQAALDAVEKKN